MLKAVIASLKLWYVGALKTWGYPGVALMMAIESSLFPLPSEIVIPPAAYWSQTHQVPLSLTGIIIAGTIGSWIGATVMYWAARLAGRPLILRYGPYVMISPAKMEGACGLVLHVSLQSVRGCRRSRACPFAESSAGWWAD